MNVTISGNTFGSRNDIDHMIDELGRRLKMRKALA